MNAGRTWAMMKKELRQIRRDPRTLGQLVVVPVMMLLLYGYALTFDVKHIPLAVLDQDRTPGSRDFARSLFGNEYFDRVADLDRPRQAEALLAGGQARAVLVIPRGFGRRLLRDEEVPVQALFDGMDSNSASTALGYLQALTASYSARLVVEELRRKGIDPQRPAVTAETRIWYNPELESARFLVPGLIALVLMLSCVVSTALSLVREKERGTMEQVMVSPVRPAEVIAGKILPYVLISLLTAVLILLFGSLLFDVRVRGSLLELLAAILVFLFSALGLGLFISSRTRSQQVAFMFALFATLLPSVLLSGLIFPIKNMPLPIRLLTYIVPPRHFIVILRAIILKGVGLADLLPELAALGLIGLAFYGLAVAGTRKRGL